MSKLGFSLSKYGIQHAVAKKLVYSPSQIRDFLEEDIVNGKFKPGSKLDEASLTKRFGVSRTPIREALRQLSASGMVDLIPNRGAFVIELTFPRLIEMFAVVAELEGMCARLAAVRMTIDQRMELSKAHEDCRLAGVDGHIDDYYYSNARFHELIYEGSHNSFLIEQVKHLNRRLKPYRRLQLRVPQRIVDSFDEHQCVVDAILASDECRAESCLRAHILIQGKRFKDLLQFIEDEKKAAT